VMQRHIAKMSKHVMQKKPITASKENTEELTLCLLNVLNVSKTSADQRTTTATRKILESAPKSGSVDIANARLSKIAMEILHA
jgi:glycine betaine/choline ABC-type transport system substrate-binding protein